MPFIFSRNRHSHAPLPRAAPQPARQRTLFPPDDAAATDDAALEAILQGVLDLQAAKAALRRAHEQLDGKSDPASVQVSAQIARALAAIGDPSCLCDQIGLHPARVPGTAATRR